MDAAVSRMRECCGCIDTRGEEVEPLAGSVGGLIVVGALFSPRCFAIFDADLDTVRSDAVSPRQC